VATEALITDLNHLFIHDTPLMDVRAPIEFAQGALPAAQNLPLMIDQERHAVGITYKESGQDAAIALGHTLVSGATREARIEAWVQFAKAHPDGALYCFRGGLRSQITQRWLADHGVQYPRVAGGYKAMRQYLLTQIACSLASSELCVVGGLTGSGKTDVIQALDSAIDLEGLAKHRGSSFGGRAQQQPTQVDFENQLSINLLKLIAQGKTRIAIEDESHLVGRCAIPLALRERTEACPMIWVNEPLEARVNRITRDYIEQLHKEYVQAHGPQNGTDRFEAHLTKSLLNLRKRLGLLRYDALSDALRQALDQQKRNGSFDLHRAWIEPLLTEYYDPMYQYQRSQKASHVIFEGTVQEVIAFLRDSGH
jgi:tRNA 2-selenouridine synthase